MKFITYTVAVIERLQRRLDAAISAAQEAANKKNAKAKADLSTFLGNLTRLTGEGPKLLDFVPSARCEIVLSKPADDTPLRSMVQRFVDRQAAGLPVPETAPPVPDALSLETESTIHVLSVKTEHTDEESAPLFLRDAVLWDNEYADVPYPLPKTITVPNRLLILSLGAILSNLGTDRYFVPTPLPEDAVDTLLADPKKQFPLGTLFTSSGVSSLPSGLLNVALEVLPGSLIDSSESPFPKERWAGFLEALDAAEGSTPLSRDNFRMIANHLATHVFKHTVTLN